MFCNRARISAPRPPPELAGLGGTGSGGTTVPDFDGVQAGEGPSGSGTGGEGGGGGNGGNVFGGPAGGTEAGGVSAGAAKGTVKGPLHSGQFVVCPADDSGTSITLAQCGHTSFMMVSSL